MRGAADRGGSSPGPGVALPILSLAAVLLLAFALSAPALKAYLIWADEAATTRIIGVFDPPIGPLEVVRNVAAYSWDQAPLYYVLAAGWANAAGFSPLALRYLSLLSGVMLIAWVYRLAHDMFGPRAGLAAALLLSTSAFVLVYFHEMKMYALLLMLSAAHIWLYWRLMKRRRASRRLWIAFVASTSALLYTHNLSLFLFAGLGLTHLIFERGSRRYRGIVVAWFIGALSFLPYLPGMLAGSFTRGSMPGSPDLVDVARLLSHLMTNGQDWLWLPLGLSLAYALKQRRSRLIWRLFLFTALMGAGLLLAGLRLHLLQLTSMRYLLLMWLPFVLLCGWSLTALPRAIVLATPFVLVWCLAGVQQTLSGEIMQHASYKLWAQRFPPLHRYAPLLDGKVNATDFLLGFTVDDEINEDIKKGAPGSIGDYYLRRVIGIDGTFLHASERKYRVKGDVGEILRARPHLLLAHDPGVAAPNYAVARHFIDEAFLPCPALVDQPTTLIVKFRHPVMPCDHAPMPLEYEHGIRLVDRAVGYDRDTEIIAALLWWDLPDDSMRDDYNISLQVFAADGDKSAQVDRHLDAALVPWGVVELSVSELPAGEYDLMLILYDRVTGAKLRTLDAATGESAHFTPILSFTVEAA